MSIIGHDCDGRPLSVGDTVVFVSCFEASKGGIGCPIGRTGKLIGPYSTRYHSGLDTDIPDPSLPGETFWALGEHLRKIVEDHAPCGQSFEELMHCLKRGIAA